MSYLFCQAYSKHERYVWNLAYKLKFCFLVDLIKTLLTSECRAEVALFFVSSAFFFSSVDLS